MTHGCYLRSSDKGIVQDILYTPVNEAEEAELRMLSKLGTCEERPIGEPSANVEASTEAAAPVISEATEDQLSEVPGIGKATLDKLVAEGITLKSHLEQALINKEEKMKEILAGNFQKVKDHFAK